MLIRVFIICICLLIAGCGGGGSGPISPATSNSSDNASLSTAILISAPSNVTNLNSATFEFESSPVGMDIEASHNNASFVLVSGPHTLNNLADGSHDLKYKVTNSSSASTYTWLIDTVSPDTTFNSTPSQLTSQAEATFEFSANEIVNSYRAFLDGRDVGLISSPHTFKGLREGMHVVEFTSIDLAGNMDSTPAIYSWIVDTIAPITTIIKKPPSFSSRASAVFEYNSNESASKFYVVLDGEDKGLVSESYEVTGLSNGLHTISVKAVDSAGNVDLTAEDHTWMVDARIPMVIASAGDRKVMLDWEETPGASSYTLYYGTSADVLSYGAAINNVSTPYVKSELDNHSNYFFNIVAEFTDTKRAYQEVEAIPYPSGSIMGSDSKIILKWPPVESASSYNIYYSTSPNVTVDNGMKIADVRLSYVHENLVNGTQYYYIITALIDGVELIVFKELTSTPNSIEPLISAGIQHTCALDEMGVYCWGATRIQTDVPGLRNPTQISAGGAHTCSIDDSGVVCWGSNTYGQLDVPILKNPRKVSSGKRQSCALDDNGVTCWGYSGWGILSVPELINPIDVETSWDHTCAIDDAGVKCWGYGFAGQLDPPTLNNPLQVSVGRQHSCALDGNQVVCWGSNLNDQLSIPTLTNPSGLSAGGFYSCVHDDTGIVCWGSDTDGQTNIPTLNNPTQPSAGYEHACVFDDNDIVCWGNNSYGKTRVAILKNPTQISAGQYHACAIDEGKVVCWGSFQQPTVPLSNPMQISAGNIYNCAIDDSGLVCWGQAPSFSPSFVNPTYVSAGLRFACALDEGDVLCWGLKPVVPVLSNPTQVSASPLLTNLSYAHVCAIDDTGLVCWGDNTYGQLNIPLLTNPSQVSVGNVYTCAIDDTGVHCWGNNYSNNQYVVPPLINPRQLATSLTHACVIDDSGLVCWGESGVFTVPTLSNPTHVSAGSYFNCTLDDSGVTCFGDNFTGQLNVITRP